jgi:hypothetical protein
MPDTFGAFGVPCRGEYGEQRFKLSFGWVCAAEKHGDCGMGLERQEEGEQWTMS